MSQNFTWNAGPVSMVFAYDDDQPVTMASLSIGDTAVRFPYQTPLAEVMTTDTGHMISCNKLTHTVIGRELRYSRHQTDVIGHRNELKIVLEDEDRDLEVTVRYSVDDRAPMVQTDVTVTNMGLEPVLLDSVTSWSSTFGLPADAAESAEPDLGDWDLLEGRFDWLAEGRWHRKPVRDLIPAIGQELTEVDPRQSHQVVSTGTWSTGTNVPLAILESEKQQLAWLFQIEHNGAWRWDVQDNTSWRCPARPTRTTPGARNSILAKPSPQCRRPSLSPTTLMGLSPTSPTTVAKCARRTVTTRNRAWCSTIT